MAVQSQGADPTILTEDYDPYLDPGLKLPVDVAVDDEMREELLALEDKYAHVPKTREPHEDVGCWWTLYDYGLESVKKWPKTLKMVYPGRLLTSVQERLAACGARAFQANALRGDTKQTRQRRLVSPTETKLHAPMEIGAP